MKLSIACLIETIGGSNSIYPSPCSEIRVISLLNILQKRGLIDWHSRPVGSWTSKPDILLLNRYPFVDLREADRFKKWLTNVADIPILLDVDDNLIENPRKDHPEHEHIARIVKWMSFIAARVDTITVSTPNLRSLFKSHTNADVYVIPNRVKREYIRYLKPVEMENAKRVLFMGTNGHYSSLSKLAPLFTPSSSYFSGLLLDVIGISHSSESWFNSLPFMSPSPNDLICRLHDLQGYLCGIAPLYGSESFDKYKSDIKAYDYQYAGLPIIASNKEPYSTSSQVSKCGLVVDNTLDGWKQALDKVQDARLSSLLSYQGYEHARHARYSTENVANCLYEIIRKTIDRHRKKGDISY